MKHILLHQKPFVTVLLLALVLYACTPEKLSEADYYGPSNRVDGQSPEPPDTSDGDAIPGPSTPDTVAPDILTRADITDVADETILADATPEDTTDFPTDTAPEDTTDFPTDTAPDVTPVDADNVSPDTCSPNCVNKECGEDGCGGICGICSAGNECNNLNKCAPKCQQQCTGKFCGPDGCGGTCGTCEPGFECGPDGKCYDVSCVPNCMGKVCGDDGCNGMCGECIFGDLCENGQCVTGPCSGIPETTGTCEDGKVIQCVNGEKIIENCTAIPGYTCQWNPNVSQYQCLQTGGCLPNCVTTECGDDGCGGVCGVCPGGWPCQAGQCTPVEGGQCGYFNSIGTCEADTLYYCDSNTLFIEDCNALGKTCGFNSASQSNQCI